MGDTTIPLVSAFSVGHVLREVVEFWTREFRFGFDVEFHSSTPELGEYLDVDSPSGIVVVLSGLPGERRAAAEDSIDSGRVARMVDAARERTGLGYLVVGLPSVWPPVEIDGDAFARDLQDGLAGRDGIEVVSPGDYLRRYPVADWPSGSSGATEENVLPDGFWVSLGSYLVRRLAAASTVRAELIAVGVDGLLWNGWCAEDSVAPIRMEDQHRALRSELRAESRSGRRMALCSTNLADDVLRIFRDRPDGAGLSPDDFHDHVVNWNERGEQLESLLSRETVAPASAVLLDPDPYAAASATSRTGVPSLVPTSADEAVDMLRHYWPLDPPAFLGNGGVSPGGVDGTAPPAVGGSVDERTHGLADTGGPQVSMTPIAAEDLETAVELIGRTRRFACTELRPDANELVRLRGDGGWHCLGARLRDRFGEHGLVGVLLAEDTGETLCVRAFVISASAEGRGVEHAMLRYAAEIAESEGLEEIVITLTETERNVPARAFLDRVASEWVEETSGGRVCRIPVEEAWDACEVVPPLIPPTPPYVRIANELRDVASITAAMERSTAERRRAEGPVVEQRENETARRPAPENSHADSDDAPWTATERWVARAWKQLTGATEVGRSDSLTGLGASSIQAMRWLGEVQRERQLRIPTSAVLGSNAGLSRLARLIDESEAERPTEPGTNPETETLA